MTESRRWVVLKFGGTSVSSRENWGKIQARIEEIQREEEATVVVVCSALSGISDALQGVIDEAPRGSVEDRVEAIRARHQEMGESLGVEAAQILEGELQTLERLAQGASLVGEVSPGVQARIMALGELMSTRLGAAFLQSQGLALRWEDARTLLTASDESTRQEARRFLSATCDVDDDPGLREKLSGAEVVLTQGFIAADDRGRTVLLGRGGSDTSAAYFAARLGAERLEIWTDVPGMFTANPRQVGSARLLRRLDYDEAQELATMGAKVLHPRCLPAVRSRSIPLHLRCTPRPELEGTVISGRVDQAAQVKAISAKKGVTTVSMATLGMWQQVGFLADAFQIFKARGLSVDLVATSESNVTVTLDPLANALEPEVLAALKADLDEVCTARITPGCAVVSLVGRQIRSILSRLAPTLKVFEEHQVHLVSQAASDLNLSLVVDEEQADRLVKKLHGELFDEVGEDPLFGPRWNDLVAPRTQKPREEPWWVARRQELVSLAADGGALYAYDEATLRRQARALLGMSAVNRVFYAMKANPHRGILALFEAMGLGFECVSPGELRRVRECFPDLDGGRLLFTPNFAGAEEYRQGYQLGAMVTLDNLFPLQEWGEIFAGQEVLVRVDPGQGRGHHRYVRTAGPRSKFGVSPEELPELAELAARQGATVVGLHAHVGSGVLRPGTWTDTAVFLEQCRELFPEVGALNLGGGLGVVERRGQSALDLDGVDRALQAFKEAHPDLELWMEPGRFLVSEAGVLLAKVTQTKTKGDVRYVGVETGMNTLIRPALYGAHHGIVNLTKWGREPDHLYEVVGPICESGDVLGHARRLPETGTGDVLLIQNAGAYGRAMSSEYNLRLPADEVLLATEE